ncbi:sphingolipid delta-4 desaturase [Microbotryomycetes sp. JL221]|nr:sphingolipid delta-4 desaturase [Microbotryomycetes sp. JL221]
MDSTYRHPVAATTFPFDLAAGAESLPPSSTSSPSSAVPSDDDSDDSTTPPTTAQTSADDETDCDDRHSTALRTRTAPKPGHAWAPNKVEPKQDTTDWLWMMTEEPHRSRRKAVLKAHPEIRKLMGYEPLTKYVVLAVTALQIATAYLLRNSHFFSWKFWIVAYVIGATANQNTFLAVHEITHNLAFRGVKANRLFAIFANLPIGVPYAMMFKKYHIEHHKYLGEDGIDTDLPSKLELVVLRSVLGKAFFASFQIFFYALRPGFIRYQAPTRWIALNWFVQLSFDALIVKYMGWTSMLYLLLSSHLAGSLHPLAGHFIAEHYLFDELDQETWSYYGPLNIFAYNVGYHNEHHDFPSVAWTKLPELRRIASDFYDPLPQHTSWPGVTYRFIFDSDIGLWSRAKRKSKSSLADNGGGGMEAKSLNAGGLKDE